MGGDKGNGFLFICLQNKIAIYNKIKLYKRPGLLEDFSMNHVQDARSFAKKRQAISKIIFTYILVVGIWVLISDNALLFYVSDPVTLTQMQTFKGLLTILLSSVVLYVILHRNMLQIQQSEDALLESRLRYHSLIEQNPDAICFFDLSGEFVTCNPAAEIISGYQTEELLQKSYKSLVVQADHALAADSFQQSLQGEPQFVELSIVHKAGHVVHLSVKTVPVIVNQAIAGVYIIAKDMSERIEDKMALQDSEGRLRTLIQHMPDYVTFKDGDGRWLEANEYALRFLQLEDVSYRGKTDVELSESSHFFKNAVRFIAKSDESTWELGATARTEATIPLPDGAVRLFDVIKMPVYYPDGGRQGLITLGRDMTEQKRTNEFLRKSEKLSVVGQLAAGVAHEIRNPLTALKGFVQLLQAKYKEEQSYFEVMLSELDRINMIVTEFLYLAKPQMTNFQEKDLPTLIQHILSLLETQAILNNVQIRTEFEPGIPLVKCEENQIKQVFINILKNAIESMTYGGEIVIRVRSTGNEKVLVQFVDQGCGIPKEWIPKLGEPFYTTKEKGTGLGLMVSYKIIEEHHGTISIESEADRGTTVNITLPVHSGTVHPDGN